ncbi:MULTISPECIES: hypothetical protein [Aneurinibacillus]|uniref:Uncharacterized protein n=1 Tax=Aneurinibacillus thermoaerophilus TaxID=143495 RepID=A0A1G7XD44_ANETH|nr:MULTISPECIES: hypothetical protein [Aneurinibacillus]MED0677158.1 hypothetical protein [Aneurinibacillus thermoaerophilus]MED0680529.1 hypothetical protein [Aneurinibacillus thermoaerophilus]MED0736228.1 hypothetical protein [Aneurinibacillus thermoaerophilus]MED0758575.1 hypothetical protein [Aneurinibacillus thermoaerophilus]MED0760469.1 hypothetical protein [Aneurinibacillus thermoaerophilus]
MNRIEILVNSADEMCQTMKTLQHSYPNATFEKLEYIGIENGQLSIKLSYILN